MENDQLLLERIPEYMEWVQDMTPEELADANAMLESLSVFPLPSRTLPTDMLDSYVQQFLKNMDSIRGAISTRTQFTVRKMDKTLLAWILDVFYAYPDVRAMVQVRIVRHSKRQNSGDLLIVKLATTQGHFIEAFIAAKRVRAEMNHEDLAFYLQDPELFPVEVFANNLIEVENPEDQCNICFEDYSTANTGGNAVRGPCKHIFCKDCLDNWLMNASEFFSCPLCRKCLVCGTSDCPAHRVVPEAEPPIPLDQLLRWTIGELPPGGHKVLNRQQSCYFHLFREETRYLRIRIAVVEKGLGVITDRGSTMFQAREFGLLEARSILMRQFENAMSKYQIREILEGRRLRTRMPEMLLQNWGKF